MKVLKYIYNVLHKYCNELSTWLSGINRGFDPAYTSRKTLKYKKSFCISDTNVEIYILKITYLVLLACVTYFGNNQV